MRNFFMRTTKTLIRLRGCADLNLRWVHTSEGTLSVVAVRFIKLLVQDECFKFSWMSQSYFDRLNEKGLRLTYSGTQAPTVVHPTHFHSIIRTLTLLLACVSP